MTAAARKVLSDCVLAHQLLNDEIDTEVWRVHWVGALSLIRAVGHVLESVDGEDPNCRKISDEMYCLWRDKSIQEHQIFREFIKHERDLMLKEYATTVNLEANVPIFIVPDESLYLVDQNIFRPMNEGPWAGEDGRDVYELAIEWWASQLNQIDNAMATGT